jgi:protein ImuB
VAFSSTLAEDFSRELKEGSHQSAYPFLLDWPRPPRLLSHPEPIETMALLPDHPPVWFSWRGIRRRVTRADGPERVFGEWWQRDAELIAVRDYFQVEDESGERFWIYRAGDGEDPATGSHKWFMHGVFA